MLLVVLECLKDRAFHIRTVYVNSLDPNGIVWRLGKCFPNGQFHNASSMVSWFVLKSLCGPHKLFGNFLISPLSMHSLFEAIFSQDVAKEGRQLSGIRYVPLTCIIHLTFMY